MAETPEFQIDAATADDVPVILRMVQGLAEYEKLSHKVTATPQSLRETLFGPWRCAEVILGRVGGEAVGFAVFFPTYSTFLGRPGMYLEDLFVEPEWRGHGFGKRLLADVARTALERGCGRLEWATLNWNEPAIGFYRALGARANDEWTTFRISDDALQSLARTAISPV
jgi:GNAT superfamily N-acetyltransferase